MTDTANQSHLNERQAVNASSRDEATLPEGLKHGAAGLYEGPSCCTTLTLTACRLAGISKQKLEYYIVQAAFDWQLQNILHCFSNVLPDSPDIFAQSIRIQQETGIKLVAKASRNLTSKRKLSTCWTLSQLRHVGCTSLSQLGHVTPCSL